MSSEVDNVVVVLCCCQDSGQSIKRQDAHCGRCGDGCRGD